MVIKLRPGWVYNAKGKAVPKETVDVYRVVAHGRLMPDAIMVTDKGLVAVEMKDTHTKRNRSREELIAIRASYAKRGKSPPKHPFVLEGAVKMTPRRYELLSAVLTEALSWVRAPDFRFGGNWARDWRWSPRWDGKQVDGTLTTLRRLRLIRWREKALEAIPEVTLTARGLQAIEEYESNLKGVTQP